MEESLAFDRWLVADCMPLREVFPCRQVNTINFDSPDLQSYCDNLDGISQRSKIRFRWYGQAFPPIDGVFELKHKVNSVGFKDSWKLDLGNSSCRTWGDLFNSVQNHLPDKLQLYRGLLRLPVILNQYQRSYFEIHRDVRMTVDNNLRARAITPRSLLNEGPMAALPVYRVIEIKFPRECKSIVNGLTKNLPLRPTKYSKYVSSIDRCYP